ncbi:MAG: Inner rane transport permease YbhR [Pseudomonadota bacterium]|jgi:ABC-type multidrug transport system permease subunit
MRDPRPPLLELTFARVREFSRDPGAIFWTFGFPVVLAVALGLAFRSSPTPELRVALSCAVDCEHVAEALGSSPELTVQRLSRAESQAALRRAKLDLIVEVDDPRGVNYRFDPTRPEGKSARMAAELAIDPNPMPRYRASEVREVLPGSRYIDFLLPGLLGVNLLSSSVWGISFSLVEARRRKLLKQLSATPMQKRDYLASIMLSRLLFLAFEVVAILGFGALVFAVPIRGSIGSVFVFCLLGSFSFTGLALWVASRVRSIEAASGWSNVVILPMWLLSGVFFSYERFPEWLWPWLRCLPLTALNVALRSLINEGRPLMTLGHEALVLVTWSVLTFVIALRTFRWQ